MATKRVVSVSLGSASRDHRFETEILGQRLIVERIGTDGDFISSLTLPIPLRTLTSVKILAALLLPAISRLPIRFFYPTGEKQNQITPKHGKYYRWAEIVAGDFLLIRRFMPDDLRGKVILTQTITQTDVDELRKRGVWLLITDGPDMGGRSFATNVLQGVIVALLNRRPEGIATER